MFWDAIGLEIDSIFIFENFSHLHIVLPHTHAFLECDVVPRDVRITESCFSSPDPFLSEVLRPSELTSVYSLARTVVYLANKG
jgi:hypothetical protein